MTKKDVMPPFALDSYVYLVYRAWIRTFTVARTAALTVGMNLLLPLYSFRQEINFILLASELFTSTSVLKLFHYQLLWGDMKSWHHLISLHPSCFDNINSISISTLPCLGQSVIGSCLS
ncbi:hypothetical protein GOODEAATRI_008744 [Goodea atripinnis]|uniref:Uncharacterized protein n=1 Tax=Goodea atripinnis TaxID=208336 RepID=A0ABV0PCN1_9TELE